MRAFAIPLLVTLGLSPALAAVDVTVIAPDGTPDPEAMVACVDGSHEAVDTGDDGHAVLKQACRKVWCQDGRFLPLEQRVTNGAARCRLAAGARVIVEPIPEHCLTGCGFLLRNESGDIKASEHSMQPPADAPEFFKRAAKHIRFTLVPPGSYRLAVEGGDGWYCEAPLARFDAGEHTVTAPAWRPPLDVHGIVVDANGRPRANVLVRAKRDPSRAATTCGRLDPIEAATDREGRFSITIDPEADVAIVAGEADDPLGTGEAPLTSTTENVTITVSGH